MVSPRRILLRAAERHGVTPEDVLGPRRHKGIAAARHDTIKALRHDLGWSLPRIGNYLNRHHTTVLYVLNKERVNEDTQPHDDV